MPRTAPRTTRRRPTPPKPDTPALTAPRSSPGSIAAHVDVTRYRDAMIRHDPAERIVARMLADLGVAARLTGTPL